MKFTTIKIIPHGTHVVTLLGGIKAMVTATIIRFDKVEYELSYFAGGERKAVWVSEYEFVPDDQKQKTGFIKQSK